MAEKGVSQESDRSALPSQEDGHEARPRTDERLVV